MECASLVSTHRSGSSLTWEPYLLGGCVNNLNLRVIFSCLETSQLFNKPTICGLANYKILKICKLICRLILKMFLFAEITTIDNKNKYYCYVIIVHKEVKFFTDSPILMFAGIQFVRESYSTKNSLFEQLTMIEGTTSIPSQLCACNNCKARNISLNLSLNTTYTSKKKKKAILHHFILSIQWCRKMGRGGNLVTKCRSTSLASKLKYTFKYF